MSKFQRLIPWLICLGLAVWLLETRLKMAMVIAQKDAQIKNLEQQQTALVEEANKQLKLAHQREAVRVAFRNGGAEIINISDQTLVFSVEIARPNWSEKKRFSTSIESGQSKELGEREGWQFSKGDKLTISQPKHKTLVFTAP
jgi:hypothetical protein